jgi:hypothetical protein
MIHEYAVSPALFGSPGNLNILFHAFEEGTGRLISDYPKRAWIQYVREFIKRSVVDQVEQRAWMELLMRLQRHVLTDRQGPLWNEGRNWIDNAIDEHHRRSFHGIVNDKAVPPEPNVISFGALMHSHSSWITPSTISIPRQAVDIVNNVVGLLDISATLVLIDRNFSPSETRFLNVLSAFAEHLRAATHPPRITQIKYVTAYEKDRNIFSTPQMFEQTCAHFLPSVIPIGIEVKFLIKVKTLLHKRLVMTNWGAVLVEHGLDEGPDEVLLARLSADNYRSEWSQWDKQVMHSFTIAGAKT